MNRTVIISLFAIACFRATSFADPPSRTSAAAPPKPFNLKDPRGVMWPTILYDNQKGPKHGFYAALLIFARWDVKPPNEILGVKETFTDDQIITGLRKFYREWRPPAEQPDRPPPQLIFAQQNWGCGAGLFEPLKALCAEFKFDVYSMYPVVNHLASDADSPTPGDKRLVELIKGD